MHPGVPIIHSQKVGAWCRITLAETILNFSGKLNIILIPFIFMIVSLVLSLKKKNNTCNKIGLGLALASAFLIITEIMVIIIY